MSALLDLVHDLAALALSDDRVTAERRAQVATLVDQIETRFRGLVIDLDSPENPPAAEAGAASTREPDPETAPVPRGDVRYYCVWGFGAAHIRNRGAGIWWGEHPATWNAILQEGGVTEYPGSGLRLKSYKSIEQARAAWSHAGPRHLRGTLPETPPEFTFTNACWLFGFETRWCRCSSVYCRARR